MKILAIGAHPDDIEIFMYGFLSVCLNRGDEIYSIIATDGSAGTVLKEKKLNSIRENETKIGLSKLSKPMFLGFPDGKLSLHPEISEEIKNQLKIIKPNLILTHYKEDYHPDHRALSNNVFDAAGFQIPILYCDTLMGVNFLPDYYVEITDHFEEKKEAILSHKSQNPEKFINAIKLQNSFRAGQCNYDIGHYVEAYKFEKRFPFSEIGSLIPHNIKIKPYYNNNLSSLI